jgi:hypothetical protein
LAGEAALGVWRDSNVDIERKKNKSSVFIPSVGKVTAVHKCVIVADDSIDTLIKRGSYAVFEGVTDGFQPALQDILYVQRERNGLIEMTLRRVVKQRSGRLGLATASSDVRTKSTIDYPSTNPDEAISIIGKVVGSYVPI